MALNQKNRLNLLTNFLRSFQIHKGPTSDIGTLSDSAPYFIILLCLTPDDFTRQGESAATQWVNSTSVAQSSEQAPFS
jgi:hypothetical protein